MGFGGRAVVKYRKGLTFFCFVFKEKQLLFFSDSQGWVPQKELLADVEQISFSKGVLS